MRYWKLSGLLAVAAVFVGAGYAVSGHPIALASGAAVALILVAPEINDCCYGAVLRRCSDTFLMRTLFFYTPLLLICLGLVAGYLIAAHRHGVDDKTDEPLRTDPAFFLLTVGCGVALFGTACVGWVLDLRRTRARHRQDG